MTAGSPPLASALVVLALCLDVAGWAKAGEARCELVKVTDPAAIRQVTTLVDRSVRWPTPAKRAERSVARERFRQLVPTFRDWLGRVLQDRWVPEALEECVFGMEGFWEYDAFGTRKPPELHDALMAEYQVEGRDFRLKQSSTCVMVSIRHRSFGQKVEDWELFFRQVAGRYLRGASRLLAYNGLVVARLGPGFSQLTPVLPEPEEGEDEVWGTGNQYFWVRGEVFTALVLKRTAGGRPFAEDFGVKDWFSLREELARVVQAPVGELVELMTAEGSDPGTVLKARAAFVVVRKRKEQERRAALDALMASYDRLKRERARIKVAQRVHRLAVAIGPDAVARASAFLTERAQQERSPLLRSILLRPMTEPVPALAKRNQPSVRRLTDARRVERLAAEYAGAVRAPTAAERARHSVPRDQFQHLLPAFREWLGYALNARWVPADIDDRVVGLKGYLGGADMLLAQYEVEGHRLLVKQTSAHVVVTVQAEEFGQEVENWHEFLYSFLPRFSPGRARLLSYCALFVDQVGEDLFRLILSLRSGGGEPPAMWHTSNHHLFKKRDTVVIVLKKCSATGEPVTRDFGVRDWFAVGEEIAGLSKAPVAQLLELIGADGASREEAVRADVALEQLLERTPEDRSKAVEVLLGSYGRTRGFRAKLSVAQRLARLYALVEAEAQVRVRRFLQERATQEDDVVLRSALRRILDKLSDQPTADEPRGSSPREPVDDG